MNIGSKLILSFLLVTIVPTILLAYLTTTIINNSGKQDAQITINNNLRAAWMQYYARAYQMQYGMLQASTETHIKKALEKRDHKFLREQLSAWKTYRPYVDFWAFVDKDGYTVASHNIPLRGIKLSLDGFVEKALRENTSVISSEVVPSDFLSIEGLEDSSRVYIVPEIDVRSVKGELKGGTTDIFDILTQDFQDPTNVTLVTEKAGQEVIGEIKDGLMLVVVTPVTDEKGSVIGGVITGDLINNDTFVPDTLAEFIPGSLATIAMGEVQISTNVIGEEGERAVGQVLPKQVVEQINLNMGFRGETAIARKNYIAAFDPIKNYKGEIIGSLFVAAPMERFVELHNKNIKAVIMIALVGLFLATAFASLITYMITRPIAALTKKAQLVSAGKLDLKASEPRELDEGNDEITNLARTFDIMVGNLRENEERIQASQDKLRQQKNLIESIINSLPYCLYVLERNMGIVAWNRHSAEPCPICNCSTGDCSNVNFVAHLENEELKEGLAAVINSVFETGRARFIEQKFRPRQGGKDIIILTSIFPIVSERNRAADYVVWMAEDITKKKEIEASIISSEKLAAIGQLAAGIAHEVNNPLGGILNCLYNFRNKKLTDERKGEYLTFMEEGIKRVQNIVRQLLDFSQQHAPELMLTDVNKIIEGLIPLFLHTIKGKDIRLVTNLGEGLPPILVDKHQIEQILVNLILNAIQSVKDEGVIEVLTMFENDWFCIHVSDNGCGIPSENVSRIFDPFFTTKGVGKGTGLGLSVSRGIIERHRGRIEVESEPGKGSIFKVYLPIANS